MEKTEHDPTARQARERLAPGEWPIFRACWRLGAHATTQEIVREVQTETLLDYNHVQTLLRRLAAKGILSIRKDGPRTILWSAAQPPEEVLRHEIQQYLTQVVGRDPIHLDLARRALEDVAGSVPPGLPPALRVRLIEFLDRFLTRQHRRQPLARALGLSSLIGSKLAWSIALLAAAGGDCPEAALKVITAAESLLEDGEDSVSRELAALRRDLEAST